MSRGYYVAHFNCFEKRGVWYWDAHYLLLCFRMNRLKRFQSLRSAELNWFINMPSKWLGNEVQTLWRKIGRVWVSDSAQQKKKSTAMLMSKTAFDLLLLIAISLLSDSICRAWGGSRAPKINTLAEWVFVVVHGSQLSISGSNKSFLSHSLRRDTTPWQCRMLRDSSRLVQQLS